MIYSFAIVSVFVSVSLFLLLVSRRAPKNILEIIGEKSTSDKTMERVRDNMEKLGDNRNPDFLMGVRTTGTVLCIVAALIVLPHGIALFYIFMACALLVYYIPFYLLYRRNQCRLKEIQREFPRMVTLTRIYARVGDLYQSLKLVRNVISGELKRQMDILAAELEVYPLDQALDNLDKRCNYPPLTNFVSVVMMGVTTGAEVDEILNTYSRRAYEDRVNEIKRQIKRKPYVITTISAVMMLCFLLIFIVPMFSNLIDKLNAF